MNDSCHCSESKLIVIILAGTSNLHKNNLPSRSNSPFTLPEPTILDKIVGTFVCVFFKVLKNFHNQGLTCKTLSVSSAYFPSTPIPQINVVGQHVC